MTREEYLKRPLIEDVVYEISENRIRIASPHTIFIEITKSEIIPLTEVEHMLRIVKKAVKEKKKNITLKGVAKSLSSTRELYKEYSQANETISKNFIEAVQLVQQIKVDGIHNGCLDDEVMIKLLEKQYKITQQYHQGTAFSQFTSYYYKLKEIRQNIQKIKDEECKINNPETHLSF